MSTSPTSPKSEAPDPLPLSVRRVRRSITALVVGALLALGMVSLSAPSASAAAPSVEAGVNLRPCVDLGNGNCAPVGVTDGGTLYKMRCYRDGSTATGRYTSNRWFLVSLANGQEGYVHSSYVYNQVGTPECGTLPYVRAADFAIGLIGQTYAPDSIANAYSDWAPGPKGEWSGDCAKLTHVSFTRGAGVGYRWGNAIDQYNGYRSDGKIVGGIPRYGEPVFYNIAQPYGHTAIYVGGLTVVSTLGMDNDRRPVSRVGLYSFSNYLGWASL